jgi:putative ATP-dependent endonuclease of OLD family
VKVSRLLIENFRGIRKAALYFPDHAVLIGDNNTGKSTVLEALDLALGPDRLSRLSPIDEHDFHLGFYLDEEAKEAEPQPRILVEATVTGLSQEQLAHFNAYIEWWNTAKNELYIDPDAAGLDAAPTVPALRVTFIGRYDPIEDDFEGKTFFATSLENGSGPEPFGKRDKQRCGFLYLRSIRTGTRALSLERGSLLDIILRLKEIRPKMWEDTLSTLAAFDVGSDPEAGLSGVLESIDKALKKYVPREWGARPHLRVSRLTRQHLREVISAFLATGGGEHAAPYYRQGNGTINMLLLAMLSQIAAEKQNVIFAMEEPETAIPPYAQKRIVHELRALSAQSIVTSHSPYILEEFATDEVLILNRNDDGDLAQSQVALPTSIKQKRYRQEFRTRFCEGLLSRRVLIAEGATEATALPAVARRLSEVNPGAYASLEALGITVLDAGSESQVADLAALYRSLGKDTYAVCDHQQPAAKAAIEASAHLFMHAEHGIENLVLNNTPQAALQRFAGTLAWPPHLVAQFPNVNVNTAAAISEYFKWAKGNWGLADFLAQCSEAEIPAWLRQVCIDLKQICQPAEPAQQPAAAE